MKSKFYIITRFNAPCFVTRPDLAERRLNDEWLKERVRLFKAYCYPSIVNQTFQDFEWIVWCHPDSPAWMRHELKMLDRAHFVFEPSYYDYIDMTVDTLVTTRIDNDDMIHRDFMKVTSMQLRSFHSSGLKRQVFSFTRGYRFIEKDNELLRVVMPNSPFLTLFADIREDTKDWSVYCTMHGTLPDKFDTAYNEELSAWSWVKHESNTASISAIKDGEDKANHILPLFGVHK